MIAVLSSVSIRSMAVACAAFAVLFLAALMIWPSDTPPGVEAGDAGPIIPRPLPSGLDLERDLFKYPVDPGSAAPPPDAPVLAGVVGRLPHDAVAMVRDDDGRTRILAVGQSHRGWRLESLSGDAALFRRGTQHVRVAIPSIPDPLAEDQ